MKTNWLILGSLIMVLLLFAACTRDLSGQADDVKSNTTGTLAVDSIPSGAIVLLDEEKFGPTPKIIDNLLVGPHRLTLRLNGYPDKTGRIDIYPGQVTYILWNLTSSVQNGSINVTSNPVGANIYLDGVSHGLTPELIQNVALGTHLLRLTKEGYQDKQGNVVVYPAQVTFINWNLTPEIPQQNATGNLSVNSLPTEAKIYLDGEYLGLTPKIIHDLEAGAYYLELTKDGYEPSGDNIVIEEDALTSIYWELEPSVNDTINCSLGEYEDLFFGECYANDYYDDTDLACLLDTTIDFNNDDIDVMEKIFVTNNICAEAASYDEEYDGIPRLVTNVKQDSFYYRYEFQGDVAASDVGEDSDQDTLDIRLLGKDIKIIAIEDGEMTVDAGTEELFDEGDSLNIDGHIVKLIRVGSSSARVKVDSQELLIGEGDIENFDDAGGYQVGVKDGGIQFTEDGDDNAAVLRMGQDIIQQIAEKDFLELFGEPDNSDEAEWYWKEISVVGGIVKYIDVGYNQKRTMVDNDFGFNALKEGESILFPNSYGCLEFTNVDGDTDRHDMKVYFEDDYSLNSNVIADVLVFSLPTGEEYFRINTTLRTDRVFVQKNGSNWYLWYNDDGVRYRFGPPNSDFELKINNDVFVITPTVLDQGNVTIEGPEGDVADAVFFQVKVTNDGFQYFGNVEEDADGELVYNGLDISGVDEPYLSDYGTLIKGPGASDGPEDAMDADELHLLVPNGRSNCRFTFFRD